MSCMKDQCMGTQHAHKVVVKRILLQRIRTTIQRKNTESTESSVNKICAQICTTAVEWNRMHVGNQHAQTVCMWVSVIIRQC